MSIRRRRKGWDGLQARANGASLIDRLVESISVEIGLGAPVKEYRFAPPRRWRFDYAWPKHKLALEVQGGLFKGRPCPLCGMRRGGRHNNPAAMLKEYEKLNHAAMLGWRVVYATPDDMRRSRIYEVLKEAAKHECGDG